MYAKLVVGNAADGNIYQCIRDMCRLLTSQNPSINDLSGLGFSTSTSAVLDNTPAGWTYVGSSKATDTPSIGSGSADATFISAYHNFALSAPMKDDSTKLKYAIFTQAFSGASLSTPFRSLFSLTGAEFVTSNGIVTNEGYRQGSTATGTNITNSNLHCGIGSVIHLIANGRHITVIQEGKGMMALWETTTTDVHTFYNKPAFVTYFHPTTTINGIAAISSTTTPNTSTTLSDHIAGLAFGVTNPNNGTFYGTFDLSAARTMNFQNFFQCSAITRANSIDALGNPKYQISPVFVHASTIGYPVQYITGVVPIYWCKSGIGSTGDTVDIDGDSYLYFNAGTTGTAFGVLLKTS